MEPISSAMSLQAQGSTVQKFQTTPPEKPETADAGREAVQAAEKVDKTTSVVENTQEKGMNNEEQGKDQQATNEQIRKAVEQMSKGMGNSEVIFGIHDDTNRVTIKIVDKKTKEVIKELPPEKTLDMIARVWDMAGILVDEKR